MRGLVAQVEGELAFVDDLAGGVVEAGSLSLPLSSTLTRKTPRGASCAGDADLDWPISSTDVLFGPNRTTG